MSRFRLAGKRVDVGDTGTIRSAEPEDEGIQEMLPPESPVSAEIREAYAQDDAAVEADWREQEEEDRDDMIERAREVRSYAAKIDTAARLARSVIIELRASAMS